MNPKHATYLEINLDALTHNFRYLKSKIAPTTKFIGVVKALSYGSDDVRVALHLESLGIDYLAVAFPKEGVKLREGGVKTPIMVFHPLENTCEEIVEYALEPSLYNYFILDEFTKVLSEKKYPIHLKFNTGLNRLGFAPNDTKQLIEKINAEDSLQIKSIYSHLAASEDYKENAFTLGQIKLFEEQVLKTAFREIDYSFETHILNTSGIISYAHYQFDMVRSGIGLYGFANDSAYQKYFRPIATLKTKISQIHCLEKGASIGYNRGFTVKKQTKVAVLPIGHADGIDRIYGKSKGYVYINDTKCYILGNVCMDMIMVDVSQVNCSVGDMVVIFGEKHSAEILSEDVGTISYELITGIAPRVERTFVKD